MRIYLVRHAAAIERAAAGIEDEDRWLTAEGRRRYRKVSKRFARIAGDLSAIYTSPLVRATQTAEQLAEALKFAGAVEVWRELAPGHPARDVALRLRELGAGAVVALVGHEPQLSEIGAVLMGREDFPLPFPKGGIAFLELSRQGPRGRVRFHWMLVPKGRRLLGLDGKPVVAGSR